MGTNESVKNKGKDRYGKKDKHRTIKNIGVTLGHLVMKSYWILDQT